MKLYNPFTGPTTIGVYAVYTLILLIVVVVVNLTVIFGSRPIIIGTALFLGMWVAGFCLHVLYKVVKYIFTGRE